MPLPPLDAQITFIYVADLERSAAFYEQTLELPLAVDQGGCRIYRVVGGGYLGICHRAETAPATGRVIITFVTDDVDGWHQALIARGIQVDHPPAHNERYGIYHFFLRDPDGYLLEVQRFERSSLPRD